MEIHETHQVFMVTSTLKQTIAELLNLENFLLEKLLFFKIPSATHILVKMKSKQQKIVLSVSNYNRIGSYFSMKYAQLFMNHENTNCRDVSTSCRWLANMPHRWCCCYWMYKCNRERGTFSDVNTRVVLGEQNELVGSSR